MASRLDWSTGSHGLRRGVREETRDPRPTPLHVGAAVIAAASPVVATVMALCAALLVA